MKEGGERSREGETDDSEVGQISDFEFIEYELKLN